MKGSRLDQMRQQVSDYHKNNPEVWELFVKYTFDRINRGFKNYSVNGIFERIRWDADAVGGDGVREFKINNNYRPFYAKRFMKQNPKYDGFFKTRVQTSAFNPAKNTGETVPSEVE